MNDYMSGMVKACDLLTSTSKEFKSAVIKVTGMTPSGFAYQVEVDDDFRRTVERKGK